MIKTLVIILFIILYVIGIFIFSGLVFHFMPDDFDYTYSLDRILVFICGLLWPLWLLMIFMYKILNLITKPSIFIAGFLDRVRKRGKEI